MFIIFQHEKWEIETRKLDNFIRTKARPHLFYMPKILNAETEVKLKESEKAVDGRFLTVGISPLHRRGGTHIVFDEDSFGVSIGVMLVCKISHS